MYSTNPYDGSVRISFWVVKIGDPRYYERDEKLVRMNKLVAASVICSQGAIFFQAGEEFARTKGGVENNYNSPLYFDEERELNQINWSRRERFGDLHAYYQGLLKLRAAYAPFRAADHGYHGKHDLYRYKDGECDCLYHQQSERTVESCSSDHERDYGGGGGKPARQRRRNSAGCMGVCGQSECGRHRRAGSTGQYDFGSCADGVGFGGIRPLSDQHVRNCNLVSYVLLPAASNESVRRTI